MLAIPSIANASTGTCDDYDNQAEAQRAKDTRDADGDGIYCETLPCPCLAPDPRAGSGGSVDPLAPLAPPVPLSFDSLTPNDGGTVAAGTIPNFTMFTSAVYGYGVRIEVSRKPTLGQDGTLADDYTTDWIELMRSDANPNEWSGRANFELDEGVLLAGLGRHRVFQSVDRPDRVHSCERSRTQHHRKGADSARR